VYLRAIAALWVFSYHLWLAMGGLSFRFGLPTDFSFGLRSFFRAGYEGVDLFFVLSGFVIAWPYMARRRTTLDRYEVVDFYQRRYFRIAPIYYCTLAIAATLVGFGLLPGNLSAWSVGAHVAFAQNFYPAWVASILGTFWTLPTEIHFYILFPFLLRLVDIQRPLRLAAWLVLFAVAYRYLALVLTTRYGISTVWTTGYLPGRIDQFGCGMAAACLVATSGPRGTRKTTLALTAVLAVGCAVLVARHVNEPFGFWYFVGPSVVGAAIALFVCTMGAWARDRQRTNPFSPMTRIRSALYLLGEASLSIYLWHLIFIELSLVATLHWRLGPAAKLLLLSAAVPITLVVSILTYRLIEAPFVARSKSSAWRQKVARLVERVGSTASRPASHL
jgi:peptidoglycan/LPS O-acetylase OafA/YrhL